MGAPFGSSPIAPPVRVGPADPGPARGSGAGARLLLGALILCIALGPRIRIPGVLDRAVDLRLQDILLVPALVFVAARLHSLRPVWGPWAVLFVAGSVVLTAARLLVEPVASDLRTVAYLGRALEPLVLAVVVAALYRGAGNRAGRTALHALHGAVVANTGWVAYQYATGQQRTLLGTGVGDLIESYGPKLVGEASAFGTGFFFAAAAALGCAELLTRAMPRWWAGGLVVVGAAGAYLSQSRVSVGAVALCLVALVLLRSSAGKRNVYGALVLATVALVVVPLLPQVGRLSGRGLDRGIDVRMRPIWEPLLDAAGDHLLVGIGPGALGTARYPWTEAHNVVLRAVLDYGLLVGAAFLAVYVTAARRAQRAAARPGADPMTRLWGALTLLLVGGVLLAGMAQDALTAVTSTHLVMLAVGLLAGADATAPVDPRAHRLDEWARTVRRHLGEDART